MRQEIVAIFLIMSIFITANEAYPGLILRHPQTRTVPAADGTSEIFVCTAQGDVSWYINDQWVSYNVEDDLEKEGYTFNEDTVTGTPHTTKNLTMTVPAKESLNGTKIQCITYGTDSVAVPSNMSWLWIAAPPQHPNVSVELTSWNTMQLSWMAPFTTEGYPIIKYIVYTTNTTTSQKSRTDIYPTGERETHTILDTPSDCHRLQFEVLAENSVGKSAAGVVSGGFPVAVGQFSVNVSVIYFEDNIRPQAAITFHLPDICIESGVSAKYILEVKNSTGFVILKTIEDYQHSSLIEAIQPLEKSDSYTVNTTVYVPSYAELGSHTTIKEFKAQFSYPSPDDSEVYVPSYTEHTTIKEFNTHFPDKASPEHGITLPLILGVTAGTTALLILLITVVIILTCVLRSCNRKSESVNGDEEMKQDTLPHGLTPNPIYDGPIYDTIKETFQTSLQPLPPSTTRLPTADSMYSETPSHNKQTSDYEEPIPHYKREVEDCYIHMESYKRQ